MKKAILFGTAALLTTATVPAWASEPEITITQEKKPKSRPWEDPAQLSYTFNRKGKDSYNVQINAGAEWHAQLGSREIGIGPFLIVNRNSQEDARQNNIEAGLRLDLGWSTAAGELPDDQVFTGPQPAPPKAPSNLSGQLNLSYARTAAYPDLKSAVCVATPDARQCSIQHKESLRGVASIAPFFSGAEGNARAGGRQLAYSVSPLLDVAYDHLLNNKINTKTGIVETGGYLSSNVGLALQLSPTFVDPAVVLKLSGQVRPRLAVSDSRRSGIEKWAERFTGSLTYFFINPPSTGKDPAWRAGVSISYSEGSDPLNGKPDESLILLSFTIGRF